jgi:hypothetical protein
VSEAVVFLARGIGGGVEAADAFFASYRSHPAGARHRLVVIAKGWKDAHGRARLDKLAHEHDAATIDLPDDGFDWGAYMRVASRLDEEWVCFLNTHSRILTDGWLATLCAAAQQSKIGAAGATGSWGTIAPTFAFLLPTVRDIYHGTGLVKASVAAGYMYTLGYPISLLRNRNRFPPFPNFHLRSNAFLIRRKLFLEYASDMPVPRTKPDAFDLESGRQSLTRFLAKRRLMPIVAGADGLAYASEEWMTSNTFRVPGQHNLIVADNQTRAYDTSAPMERRIMERSAWGRAFTPIRDGIV